jgi:hypothetical protein
MYGPLTSRDEAIKHHVVYVPDNITVAKVEILTFRGAPAFLGTRLAKLYFDNDSIILCSQMSGVVNRIIVENDQIVSSGQELFELRNVNIIRDKSGQKMNPSKFPAPKLLSHFFKLKKDNTPEELHYLYHRTLNSLRKKI